jgi:hypothetical protein
MPQHDATQAGQQLKQALDKIAQAKDNPQQIQQMVNDAKAKVDQLVQQANQ